VKEQIDTVQKSHRFMVTVQINSINKFAFYFLFTKSILVV
jgi:hypothetical protein